MKSMTGVLTLVQEERFQLLRPDDQRCNFTLAHDARLEPAELQALHSAGTQVAVHYDEQPGILTLVAHRVATLDERTIP